MPEAHSRCINECNDFMNGMSRPKVKELKRKQLTVSAKCSWVIFPFG